MRVVGNSVPRRESGGIAAAETVIWATALDEAKECPPAQLYVRSCTLQYIEQLEQRMLLAMAPDVYEQYLVCLINRARANPAGEAARYHVALNEGVPADHAISTTPKQPLAINVNLQQAGTDHSQWMLD